MTTPSEATPPPFPPPYDVAVVIPSVLRPTLDRAVRSVFAQRFPGTIQILVGVDAPLGDPAVLDRLRAAAPPHRGVSAFAPGYSTSERHGGVHPAWDGGALRTILSYAAHSRRVAYLDDDNWWGPDHLAALVEAVRGQTWAYSLRWFVAPDTGRPLGVDRWDSAGPGAGFYREQFGGWVDPNCLLIDKLACEPAFRLWSVPPPGDPTRLMAGRPPSTGQRTAGGMRASGASAGRTSANGKPSAWANVRRRCST